MLYFCNNFRPRPRYLKILSKQKHTIEENVVSETLEAARKNWISSLHSPQIGCFPLAEPTAALKFPFTQNSLSRTHRQLRQGHLFALETSPTTAQISQISVTSHWQWLLSNVSDSNTLQVALGLIVVQSKKWCFPLFTATLEPDKHQPAGFLHINPDTRLNLNTTAIKILARKYGIDTSWLRQAQDSNQFKLDTLWEKFAQALCATSSTEQVELLAEGRVGLVNQEWRESLKDLLHNLDAYCGTPLVKQYASTKQAQPYPRERYANLDLTKPIYAPLKADHWQLRVPAAFGKAESFVLSGSPATGKSTAVVNAICQNIVEKRTTLVVGSRQSLAQIHSHLNRVGLGQLFLTLNPVNPDQQTQRVLTQAWDKPVSADMNYLQTCRHSLTELTTELDAYTRIIHDPGPNQLSAWQAYTACIITGNNLDAEQLTLAENLAKSPKFPYLPSQRAQAAKCGETLSELDENSAGGIAANPWTLMGAPSTLDKAALYQAVNSLEHAIKHAHPAVLEIMSACTSLQTWPLFARWLDLLELGYGREPVELTEKEHQEVCENIQNLKRSYHSLMQEAQPILEIARDAYAQELDQKLLADAQHAENSGKLTRKPRLKAIFKVLRPYLSQPIPLTQIRATLENMAKIRQLSQEISAEIMANPLLGLSDFDALAPQAHEKFLRHADTILTAIELATQLANRKNDLTSLMPIAREGGSLGKHVRNIAGSFANVLDILKTQPPQLSQWQKSLPPLTRYLQVRKNWLASLSSTDAALQNMIAFRTMETTLKELGLAELSQWILEGKLKGETISTVINHALSLSALEERNRNIKQQSFSPSERGAQVERLDATVTEARREIANVVQASAADFGHRLDKESLKHFGAYLRQHDFSIAQALTQNLSAVLARTPVLGLTPEQVARYLPPQRELFDALIVLDSAQLPSGCIVKALSSVQQVLFVATTPCSKTFASRKATSVYQAAKKAGFPEMRFRLRYGSNLSPVASLSATALCPKLQVWPISWHPDYASIMTMDTPAGDRSFPLKLANESPGWQGMGVSEKWFEKAGNFLLNLALKNKNARLVALTYTSDLAAGIRWYLDRVLASGTLLLPNLQVSHLGDFHPQENQALVFFFGTDSQPDIVKSTAQEEFLAAFTRAMLTTNHRLWLIENHRFNRQCLPEEVLGFIRQVENPTGSPLLASRNDCVIQHLKKLLLRAGLEVQEPTGNSPLLVDLALRGGAEAPWMGILLDTPNWCGMGHTIDREVNFVDFLVQHCGFGQIEHVYLSQLINDEDEVIRRIVSLALDLAFPGDVTEGAVASEDRYSSPDLIVAAQSQRVDSWELPANPKDLWNLPPALVKQYSPADSESLVSAPRVADASAATAELLESSPIFSEIESQVNSIGVPANPVYSPPSAKNFDDTSSDLPPELQIASSIIASLNKGSIDTADLDAIAEASPDNWHNHATDGQLLTGKSLNTHSPVPIVFDVPQTAFTHITREELSEVPPPEPTLSERLGTNETDWVVHLTAPEETGKISKPGFGDFAPLYVSTGHTGVNQYGDMPEQPEQSEHHFSTTPVTVPDSTEFIPMPDLGETGIKPFVPRGTPLHNLGEKQVLDNLDDPQNATVVRDALEKVLYTEGPISTARLAKLVADAFGMQRLHPKRRDKILALLSPEVNICTTRFGEFAWPKGTGSEKFKVFRTGSIYGRRSLADICDEEFDNALTWVIATQSPLEDDASEAVAHALDLTSARTAIRSRMAAGLAKLDNAAKLERKNGRFHLQ